MKFLKLFTDTGNYKIRMTQSSVDKSKVEQIKKSMKSNSFDFTNDNNKIGYEVFDNIFYITEGHHRMQSALEIWKETKDYSCVEKLIENGLRYDISKKPQSFSLVYNWTFKS